MTKAKVFPYSSVDEYVKDRGGKRVIRKILIANNGIAAVKSMRSIRRWAFETFGDDRVFKFVVMATPDDIRGNAEYTRMADEFVEVPGGSNNNNYANVDLIVDIASRTKSHAVWAGWGHASENPRLPNTLSKCGIQFIGPGGDAMYALGDKITSTLIAQHAKVPTMPWSGDGLTINYVKDGMSQVDKVFRKACVQTTDEALEAAKKIGYPVMIKASEGGGGKGIRKATSDEELTVNFRRVQGEVPGSPIFLMKLASNCRHLEVQLLCDEHGNGISLAGRDCSIQRRHQKIIEEGPAIAAEKAVFRQMEKSAVRMAREVGYVGAGTIEYLYLEDGTYYFLELNPRLQVEHTVTEMITKVNLPAAQLNVAMGIPLDRIPDIRRFYDQEDQFGKTDIDFDNTDPKPAQGYCVACRITAENPNQGFQPSGGAIFELNFRSLPNVWGYFSVGSKGSLHEFADSQFGHLFSWGETREHARRHMIMALKDISIRGDIWCTVEYLLKLLQMDDYVQNRLSTSWLDGLIAQKVTTDKPEQFLTVVCGALTKAHQEFERRVNEFQEYMERGQTPAAYLMDATYTTELIFEDTKYVLATERTGPQTFEICLNGSRVETQIRTLSDGGLIALVNGRSHVLYSKEDVSGLRLAIDGVTCIFTNEYDPAVLRSDMPGKLVRYLVEDGAHLNKGDAFAEVEVMKMYLPLTVSEAGTIKFEKAEGAVLEAGDIISTLVLDDPSRVRRAVLSTELFPDMKPPVAPPSKDKPSQIMRETVTKIQNLLAGYHTPEEHAANLVSKLDAVLENPKLPLSELDEIISVIAERIPPKLRTIVREFRDQYAALVDAAKKEPVGQAPPLFDGKSLVTSIAEFRSKEVAEADAGAFDAITADLVALGRKYGEGLGTHRVQLFASFLREFLAVEENFATGKAREDVLNDMRIKKAHTPAEILDIARAHHHLRARGQLVLLLLDIVHSTESAHQYVNALQRLAALSHVGTLADVARSAKHMLMTVDQPPFAERLVQLRATLSEVAAATSQEARQQKMNQLATTPQPVFDLLVSFFNNQGEEGDKDSGVDKVALELYIRRSYSAYIIKDLTVEEIGNGMLIAHWRFVLRSSLQRSITAASADNLARLSEMGGAERYGMIVVVESLTQLSAEFDSIMKRYEYDSSAEKEARNRARSDSVDNVNIFQIFLRTPPIAPPAPALGTGSNRQQQSSASLAAGSGSDNAGPMSLLSPSASSASLATMLSQGTGVGAMTDNEHLGAVGRQLTKYLSARQKHLLHAGIRTVTFMHWSAQSFPDYHTFRQRLDYQEDVLIRGMDPALAYQLELKRLANYDIEYLPSHNRSIHTYFAQRKARDGARSGGQMMGGGGSMPAPRSGETDTRFFVRAVLRPGRAFRQSFGKEEFLIAEGERMLADALRSLEMALSTKRFREFRADSNHIFLNVIPEQSFNVDVAEDVVRQIAERWNSKLQQLNVSQVEVKMYLRPSQMTAARRITLLAENATRSVLRLHSYSEVEDEKNQRTIFKSMDASEPGPWDGESISSPYAVIDPIQMRRRTAQSHSTTYAYDFPELFLSVLREIWRAEAAGSGDASGMLSPRGQSSLDAGEVPSRRKVMQVVELALDDKDELKPCYRPPGSNDIGMVAWKFTMCTPECPEGRDVIVIANDITCQFGSFGPREDLLFYKASEMARKLGIPRVYLAANSGARIGLAKEVQEKFRVAWVDDENPTKGFRYLYLSKADYDDLCKKRKSVNCEEVTENGEKRYKIKDIIGEKDGLGVENLRGSGMIAGETSQAYDDIFTLSVVSGRTVGIGAYLVRLGQRVIQNEAPPIILTGAPALNKLLGREVYHSNLQLGGTKIMYPNGVSHMIAKNDLDAVGQVLQWLSYVPKTANSPLPVRAVADPVERDVEFMPGTVAYDPRHMLAGHMDSTGKFVSGFFDRGSFTETLAGWAKTVVCGRARLGGIPMGVIAVETRTVEHVIPADPANPLSKEEVLQQPGQVWFPDSAYKTAQAIQDFNKGEHLPLMIFANWRGFSAGMRDMFDQVLKFGSYIVDNLRTYTQPIFVYLPPYGELRGGSWVVLDPTINSDFMEMYADTDSRGGVLEPAGLISIKYRRADRIATMRRLDPTRAGDAKWVESMLPVYEQVATSFADLHDTPGRMKAKGVISEVVPWKRSREYFYWRLRRRLHEERVRKTAQETDRSLTVAQANELVRAWCKELGPADKFGNDRAIVQWMEENETALVQKLGQLTSQVYARQIHDMVKSDADTCVSALLSSLGDLSDKEKERVLKSLKKGLGL